MNKTDDLRIKKKNREKLKVNFKHYKHLMLNINLKYIIYAFNFK